MTDESELRLIKYCLCQGGCWLWHMSCHNHCSKEMMGVIAENISVTGNTTQNPHKTHPRQFNKVLYRNIS